ncbi:MAG: CBS domain-containing protein [Bacteroidia bacterium]|jgi:CBS domain-containing protein|nr:CBS domain-containing protein [Bacteroidia bacterium]
MKSEFTVADFMSQNVVVAGYHNKFSEALKFFSIHGMRHLPIVNEKEELVGIVSLKDLIRVIYTETQNNGSFLIDELNTKFHMGDIMTKNPISVSPDMKISDALNLLQEVPFQALPVLLNKKVVGIITNQDFVEMFAKEVNAPRPTFTIENPGFGI